MVQFAPDGVPTIDGCRPVVLQVMADGRDRPLRDIAAAVGSALDLPEEALSQRVSSGQGRLENRVGWAASSFFRAGLLDRVRRGWYRITDTGREVASRNLTTYSEDDLLEWPAWREYQQELRERRARQREAAGDTAEDLSATNTSGESTISDPSVGGASDQSGEDPLSTVAMHVDDMNGSVETELRTALQQSSPEFFEKAVLEVLWAMGYGGGAGEKQHLGKSHDGGIDGVIRQDPLGLQNVYVQAKRYADGNTVGSPDINSFYGALAQRGADRGVFITTSRFTPAASTAAEQFRGRIILIDGIRLTSLMLRYGVGVEPKQTFTVFDVDQDFFEE